ncbi:uridine phosphorylase 1 [Tribolium castaneum]|uniref:Uridine phosphorylase 1-like Protein n=1 Tax=Tribolium castaneum TaxID=7070 RepID=D6WB45_TRICA|nr:PREDICTED: uridine phosphorylase 1 [Tribolium castaneum]EEZ98937.1 Uridine phosphorylase 1-like Protein [Tribolium castaneum]|eukprot:XP_968332.1 PREDICTED: uridine phosphorylase 1 [Tribolium castaneum]
MNCANQNGEVSETRNPDGTLRLRNPNIENLKEDILYHLALSTVSHDLVKMFGDVKFVCMGGTAKRMEHLAQYLQSEINYELPIGTSLCDLTEKSHRFAMYKVGPILCVNHGMGVPSIGILLHEITKLMYHAKVKNPIFFRIGTCGGIGLKEGTVIVAKSVVDEMGNTFHTQKICGKVVQRPAKLDQQLVKELTSLRKSDDTFNVVEGVTMCADDFYEGQGRTDGAFCDHTEEDKVNYLNELVKRGVTNIEMEATAFAALTHYAGIKAALINVALVNRLNGDQVTTPKETLLEWQNHPQILVGRYIKKVLRSETLV